ncbi:MAG: 3-methyl-2-oxobutanoate hydroxymethyltransferase [Candidatus Omnitrophica bacterium]|nr:3-methyl-2-oxobutanoate hydroxymethyltransferase [Candidatus Omnitrophota bacterium]
MKKQTLKDIVDKKTSGEKITMLTAYDYPMARIIDQAGIDIILVGDSVANVVLGLDSTKAMTMDQMIYHASAVRRGAPNALVVGDMPFESYQVDSVRAACNAKRFVNEAGCDAIKLEWFDQCLDVAKEIIKSEVSVMGHIGLTPQTADRLGGFKVQGKDAESAKHLIDQAQALEQAGCFSLVLECIPDKIAQMITEKLSIPTIGIGAGPHCDGQVLVTHDILGFFDRFKPKFVKQYMDLSSMITGAVTLYRNEVLLSQFPSKEQSFIIKDEEMDKLRRNPASLKNAPGVNSHE